MDNRNATDANSENSKGNFNDADVEKLSKNIGVDGPTARAYLTLNERCAHENPSTPTTTAQIVSRNGSRVLGHVTMRDRADGSGLVVTYIVAGLNPNQEHGFHIHETGNCESSDALSAGGHFNPDKKDHGDPSKAGHHVGDLGNIKADALGIASLSGYGQRLLVPGVTVSMVMGKSLIIHEKKDDFGAANNGNAGPRWGCGLIGAPAGKEANPEPAVLVSNLVSAAARTTPIKGRLEIREDAAGLVIKGVIEGLNPNGTHGFHIHENPANAECVNQFTEVGGHYNPSNQQHGDPGAATSHLGDLGNLRADANGKAMVDITRKGLSLKGTNAINKRAFIIHDKEDDLKTQPAGGAGDRIACGIIK